MSENPPFESDLEPPFIFVSYSHTDKQLVYPIIKRIHEEGIRLWYDEGIDPSAHWRNTIAEKILESSGILAFISPHIISQNKKELTFPEKELNLAISEHKSIFSVYLEETILSPGLRLEVPNWHCLFKYAMSDDVFYKKIIRSLKDTLSKSNTGQLRPPIMVDNNPSSEPRFPNDAQNYSNKNTSNIEESHSLELNDNEQFKLFFADRPDIISDVESQNSRISSTILHDFKRLLLHLEINISEPSSRGQNKDKNLHLDRLMNLIQEYDSNIEGTSQLILLSQKEDVDYTDWRNALSKYITSIGGRIQNRDQMVAMGISILPLLCSEFRKMNSSDAHNAICFGYDHTWQIEIDLVWIMARLKDYRALPFIADALVRHSDSISFHNTWATNILKIVHTFGVDRKTFDSCLSRLIGITYSEILEQEKMRYREGR